MLKSITPNLISNNMVNAVAFYRDVLDFELINSVEIENVLIWAHLTSGDVSVMLQERTSIENDLPFIKDIPTSASQILFIIMDDIQAFYDKVHGKVNLIKPLETSFYNHAEFTITDMDGYLLTFSQPLDENN